LLIILQNKKIKSFANKLPPTDVPFLFLYSEGTFMGTTHVYKF
jgi:hypothetical protein